MSFAPQKSIEIGFRKSFFKYIKNPDRRDQKEILDQLMSISEPLVFGGVIREFVFNYGFREFKSDIDIVLKNCPKSDLASLAAEGSWQKNKFGGYRAVTKIGYFDIWRIEDTWAFRNGHAKMESEHSILDTTFFNIDAAFFNYTTGSMEISEKFERGLLDWELDINLPQNPNQISCLHRAFKYSKRYKMPWSNGAKQHFMKVSDCVTFLYGKNLILHKKKTAIEIYQEICNCLESGLTYPNFDEQQLDLFRDDRYLQI